MAHLTDILRTLTSQKQISRAAKLLLLASLSLPGIAAADIHYELTARQQDEPRQRLPEPVRLTAPSSVETSDLRKGDSSGDRAEGETAAAAADPGAAAAGKGGGGLSDRAESGKPLAIDAAVGKAAEEQISETDPARLAALVWSGASFPVENFQAYTSPFGYRASATGGYGQEFHYGLDIASPAGSYIRSWWSGTVVEVSDDSNCGTSVVIQSGDWTHIYCHMRGHAQTTDGRRFLVDREAGLLIGEGQTVAAGDRIGRVGMTGRTTGPHLHWGLKYQGGWVDPAMVVQAMALSHQVLHGQQ